MNIASADADLIVLACNETGIHMLISELTNHYCTVSWDNAYPRNSNGMLRSLRRLGRVVLLPPKTGVKIYPRAHVTDLQVMNAIASNLDRRIGRASADFSRTRTTFGIDYAATGGAWREL